MSFINGESGKLKLIMFVDCVKKNGEVIISPLPPLVELSQLGYHPFELLDIKKYVDKPVVKRKNYIPGKILPFMTSKGCVKKMCILL